MKMSPKWEKRVSFDLLGHACIDWWVGVKEVVILVLAHPRRGVLLISRCRYMRVFLMLVIFKRIELVKPLRNFIKLVFRRLQHLNIFHDQFRRPTPCFHLWNFLITSTNKLHLWNPKLSFVSSLKLIFSTFLRFKADEIKIHKNIDPKKNRKNDSWVVRKILRILLKPLMIFFDGGWKLFRWIKGEYFALQELSKLLQRSLSFTLEKFMSDFKCDNI